MTRNGFLLLMAMAAAWLNGGIRLEESERPAENRPELNQPSIQSEVDSRFREVRIAMAQILCIDGDREGNFVRIENAIREAGQENAEIVCFPETCLLGWTNKTAHERAKSIPGADSERFSQLARKYKVFLCVGLAEKADDDLFDSVLLISDEGKILLKHRKINILKELMDPPYSSGRDVSTVETRFGKIGLLICADTFDAPTLEKMSAAKPDLMLVPYGWANRESAWPVHGKNLEDTVRRAATQIRCPVIGTNLVGGISKGPWAGLVYGGQSVAMTDEGQLIAKAADRDRDVKMVKLKVRVK